MKTPEDLVMQKIRDLTKEILGPTYVGFAVKKLVLEENVKDNKSTVSCELYLSNGINESIQIDGLGDGLVDALFNGMLKKLSVEYCSLGSIKFEDFVVSMTHNSCRNKTGADSKVHVVLAVRNSSKTVVHFSHESRSMNSAAINAVVDVMEYYVNCELAVFKLTDCIEDAKKRNRMDLKDVYTRQLAEVVRSTSHVESIRRYRQKN
jgi:hypothetical protein